METTGGFACSNPLLNRIDRIWWRTQLDNMHGAVASDCPHRERSAYTGDGQTVCATVMHRFDAAAFYSKWIGDILAAQNPDTGYVPNGAPWQPGCGGGVAWGAAICIMPWEFYLHYGDRDMLARNLDGMKGYVDYLGGWADADGVIYARAPHGREPVYWMNLGDWCPPENCPPIRSCIRSITGVAPTSRPARPACSGIRPGRSVTAHWRSVSAGRSTGAFTIRAQGVTVLSEATFSRCTWRAPGAVSPRLRRIARQHPA